MPLPGNVGTGTVTGTFTEDDGSASSGRVIFIPRVPYLLDATADTVVVLRQHIVTLDGSGAFSQVLVATDDVDLDPINWTWIVRVELNGQAKRNFDITVPAGSSRNLADIAPAPAASGNANVLDGDKGDITVSSLGTVWTIDANAVTTAKIIDAAVTNAKLANMTQATVKGRAAAAGTGAPVDLTQTQLTALINAASTTLTGAVELATTAEFQAGTDSSRVPPVSAITAATSTVTPGAELVTNGTFTGNATGWTLGGGAAYGTNNVNVVSGSTMSQSITVSNGVLYRITWTDTVGAGTIRVQLGSADSGEMSSALAGDIALIAGATGAQTLTFTFTDTGAATIDSISVTPVTLSTPALIGGMAVRTPGGVGGSALAIGVNAMSRVITGSTGSNSTAVGYNALSSMTIGGNNTAIGTNSLARVSSGTTNTALGYASLQSLTTGSGNIALGYNTIGSSLSANYTVAIGHSALGLLTTGTGNTAVGSFSSDALTTGSFNTALGYNSLSTLTTGTSNTALGYNALTNGTTAASSVAMGTNALASGTTGSLNTIVGSGAGYNPNGATANATTTASSQVIVGGNSGLGSTSQDDQIVAIGATTRCTGVGAVAVGSGAHAAFSDSVALGRSTVTTVANQVAIGTRHLELTSITAPVAPSTNNARLYVQTTSGRRQLAVLFSSGASKIIAEEFGTGSPEGVITAPVGTRYTDTAATNGAVEWIKFSGAGNTGWRVVYGDTGRRAVFSWTAGVQDGSNQIGVLNTAGGLALAGTLICYMSRINQSVWLSIPSGTPNTMSTTVTTAVNLFASGGLPTGFRPTGPNLVGGGINVDQSVNTTQVLWDGIASAAIPRLRTPASAAAVGGTVLNWQTNDPWPTSLPGVAA